MERRRFLKGIAVTTAALTASSTAAAGERTSGVGTSPWTLLAPLEAGADVGLGWRILSLGAVSQGAAVLTLTHDDGGEARVHLCAIDGAAKGVAHSQSVDLILMNQGDGDLETHEPIGRVLKTLADVIRSNERQHATCIAGLMSHDERVSQYAAEQCLD
jgi:hypothetical protein